MKKSLALSLEPRYKIVDLITGQIPASALLSLFRELSRKEEGLRALPRDM